MDMENGGGGGSRLGFGRRWPRGSFRAFPAVAAQLMGSGCKWLLGWQGGDGLRDENTLSEGV